MHVTDKEKLKFGKQMGLPHMGENGMEKIKNTTVFIAGLGGGGCAASLQLALSNVGRVVLCDHDTVEYSNLGRQFLHNENTIGMTKVESAKKAILKLNPSVEVITFCEPVSRDLLVKIYQLYENLFVFVAVDKFYAHFEINDFCIQHKIPATHIAQFGYKGFLYTYIPDKSETCFKCTLAQCFEKELDARTFDENDADLPYLAPAISIVCGAAVVEILKIRLGLKNKMMHDKFFIYRGVDHSDLFETRKDEKDIFEIVKTKSGENCVRCSSLKDKKLPVYNGDGLIENYSGTLTSFRNNAYQRLSINSNYLYKYVTIWMSRECNSQCRHCYQDGSAQGMGWDYEKADRITDLFLNDDFIVFPIVNEWLPKYWNILKILKKCNASEITTNGIIVLTRHEEFFPKLHENGIKKIKFTIFPRENMEYYTGKKYDKIIEAVKLAVKDGFFVTLNLVVMKDTIESIPSYCRDAVSLGANEVQFMNYFCSDRGSKMYSQVLTNSDIKRFWELYNQVDNDEFCKGLNLDQQASFGPNPYKSSFVTDVSKSKKLCLAGETENGFFLYVDPECGIYPCPMLSGTEFKIGEIKPTKYGYYSYDLQPHNLKKKRHIKGFNRSVCGGQLFSNNLSAANLNTDSCVIETVYR